MDNLTSDLLDRWGFREYVTIFRDGRVDSGTLRILSDDEISQLIPVPGDRARFQMNLNNWKRELADLNTGPEIGSSPLEPLKYPESRIQSHYTSEDLGPLIRNSIDSNYLFDPIDTDGINYSNPSATTESITHREKSPNLTTLEPRSTEIKSAEPQDRLVASTSSALSTVSDETVECGYVLKTLKSSVDGRFLLRKTGEGKLEDNQRNILVKLLIQPIFEKDPNAQITNKQLLSWSLEIQEIFKKESAALYYTPYMSAYMHTTARNASGKLLRFIYNKRQQLRSRGIIKKVHSCSRSSSSTSSNSDVTPLFRLPAASADSTEEQREKLHWLRNCLEPWHLVEENWRATAALRLNTNYLAGSSVQDYFNEYPVLKTPTGYQLLLGDFELMYHDKSDALFTSVVALQEKVIEVAKNRLDNTRDKDIKETVQFYLNIISETESLEVKHNAVLMLLPYITSSVPLKEKNKVLWKPSKSEVRDGFITQIGSDSELETTISERKSKSLRFGKTLQPFIAFVGPSIGEILHCYVIVGDTYYKINKLLNAVDTCFKIIQATGAQYQSEAIIVWMIIQKAFYKINTPYDKD